MTKHPELPPLHVSAFFFFFFVDITDSFIEAAFLQTPEQIIRQSLCSEEVVHLFFFHLSVPKSRSLLFLLVRPTRKRQTK